MVSGAVGRSDAVLWMLTLELITPFAWYSNGQPKIHSLGSENLPPCLF